MSKKNNQSKSKYKSTKKKIKIVDDITESKISEKKHGIVEAFAANTHNGV